MSLLKLGILCAITSGVWDAFYRTIDEIYNEWKIPTQDRVEGRDRATTTIRELSSADIRDRTVGAGRLCIGWDYVS